jgi:hypothetical protein
MVREGKTQEEIITEVKTKGKYDEWVKLGSRYGLTSNILKAKFFLVRPYRYHDVDGNVVNISMVDPYYNPNVINIAVFTQLVVDDPTNVKQGNYRIVNNTGILSTSGLATCSGLAMAIGSKKIMTHLDALTNINDIIIAIKNEIVKENVDTNLLRPTIYAGCLDSTITLQKAKDICLAVGIPPHNYMVLNVSMFDRIVI